MTIEFTTFTGKAPTLEAIQVTEENVDELAAWMGADVYSIEKTIVGGERIVNFRKYDSRIPEKDRHFHRADLIVDVRIGDWLIKRPARVDSLTRDVGERYYPVTPENIDRFIQQKHTTGEAVDLDKE